MTLFQRSNLSAFTPKISASRPIVCAGADPFGRAGHRQLQTESMKGVGGVLGGNARNSQFVEIDMYLGA